MNEGYKLKRKFASSAPTTVVLQLVFAVVLAGAVRAAGVEPAKLPGGKAYVNSLGMRLVRIEPGTAMMGRDAVPLPHGLVERFSYPRKRQLAELYPDADPGAFVIQLDHVRHGDFDEKPRHEVVISRPFFIGAHEVTNAQYERFDPAHRKLRGKIDATDYRDGLCQKDDEPAVHVSWHDAVKFCRWLSKKEGLPYRLPTEAEWEYACRAGTKTLFHTGDSLPKEMRPYEKRVSRFDDVWELDLTAGRTPPNAWGLHDVHGNVEEWCADWYGPYEGGDQVDPVGREAGDMKVARGGSHNTDVCFLRSANRLGTLPEDKHWLIGFRVVQGEPPEIAPLPPLAPALWAHEVNQTTHDWQDGPDPAQPYFREPSPFVHIPPGSNGPLFSKHNHCPSIAWCSNGDLLAIWFSTNSERGREMTIAASRLRRGSDEWEPAEEFFKAPDRNMTGSSLWHDGEGTLFHLNGLEAAGDWANLALVLRTSTDNGATWSKPQLANPHHQPRNQVIDGLSRTKEGYLIQPCDAVYGGNGGTAIHVSRDGGKTWVDPGADTPKPDFQRDPSGRTIAGIHAGVVGLTDGRLLSFGRGDNRLGSDDNIAERMPMSISDDLGKTWHYSASPWHPIDGGQRLVLLRLREGPLLLVSFTDSSRNLKNPTGMKIVDASGAECTVYGMFAALSRDEGQTWPVKRLIAHDGPSRELDGGAWTRGFTMDRNHAEPRGYLAATQTPDGVIHLISSALHYALNLAWIETPMP